MSTIMTTEGKLDPGVTRLQRIIVSESTVLIWRLRNKRVIDKTPKNKWPTDTKVHNMWLRTINKRILIDTDMINKKYEKSFK